MEQTCFFEVVLFQALGIKFQGHGGLKLVYYLLVGYQVVLEVLYVEIFQFYSFVTPMINVWISIMESMDSNKSF